MRNPLLLVARPVRGADLLVANPAWAGQCVLLVAIGLLVHVVSYARVVQIAMEHLPPSASPADRQAISGVLKGQLWVSAAFFPCRMIAGFGGTALLLYFAVRGVSTGSALHFRDVFALEIYAEMALLIGSVVACAAGLTGMQENPYLIPFGMDRLGGTLGEAAAANSVNPFSFWYYAVLAIGIGRMSRLKLWKAGVAVLCAWGVTFVMQESAFDLLRNFFHFHT